MTGQKIGEGQFGMVLEGTLMTGKYIYGCGCMVDIPGGSVLRDRIGPFGLGKGNGWLTLVSN